MIRISLGIAVIIVIALIALHARPHSGPNLLKNPADLQYWQWQQIGGQASGGVTLDQGAIRLDILAVSAIDWQLMFYQKTVPLSEDRQYRITFTAKANKERSIGIKTTRPAWLGTQGTTGLSDEFQVGKDWQTYSTIFTAKNVDTLPGRAPLFIVGQQTGVIWLKDVVLQEVY